MSVKIELYSPTIRRKEMDAVLTALVEDRIGPGERAEALIQIAKDFLQFDYCLALRSPATALYFALAALGLEDGQGVLISALAPRYYEQTILALRLQPLYCDVAAGTPLASPETVEAALAGHGEARLGCIILEHTLGYSPDTEGIASLGLPVIEDCSRGFRIPLPSQGTFTILGLEERDMLTAGGGALLYGRGRSASVLRGIAVLPENNLPDMNASLGIIQFKEAARNLEKRREIAEAYQQAALRTRHKRFILGEAPAAEEEGAEYEAAGREYNNYAFALILETGMKEVKAYAKRKDILVESAFENTIIGGGGVNPELCPEAYSLSLRTALFPLYPRLGSREIERVSKLIMTLP